MQESIVKPVAPHRLWNGHRDETKAGAATPLRARSPLLKTGMAKIYSDRLEIATHGEFDVIDITDEVEKSVLNSGVTEGYALIYSPHTTCAVLVNEKESGLLSDIKKTLQRLVPADEGYLHDDFEVRTENMHEDETKNAHSHLRQLLAGRTSEYIPVSEGNLLLGAWQRVMLVEFDSPRRREALIQICGI
ncbi:MAG: secondary thiamine-phosphate synthase enzyme YjbQ [Actinomycetota bacterium]